jgi:hypothetical protein
MDSLDALLVRCSGMDGLKGYAALPVCPLALCTLSLEQLFGSNP